MLRIAITVALLPLLVSTALAAPPKARISFELLTRPRLPLTASQQWYKALTDAGVAGLQIHNGTGADKPSIDESGSQTNRHYRVVGILAADNVLHLPGGKFKLGETGRLKKWLDELGDQGAEGVTEKRSAFDFTPRQLETVTNDLKKRVGFATRGTKAASAVTRIGGGLKYKLDLDDAARQALSALKVEDELSELSSGTALSAILRPAGLALEPERLPGGEMRYRVRKAQAGREAWPVGWKPKQSRQEVLPLLFEHVNVEISELPVSEAAESIQERLEVPFLYDHNAMALHGVDPTKVEAVVPAKRMTYSQALGKILLQAKLQYDLKVDEDDRPFLWITTVKAAPGN